MKISTPLIDEILQNFARFFPMPGRIDGRDDYLAFVETWADQLEPYDDEQVKEACRRLMGKLKRFPYPSDVRDELAPASTALTTVASLSIDVDTTSIDVALAKVEQLRIATAVEIFAGAPCQMTINGASPSQLKTAGSDMTAAIKSLIQDPSGPLGA